MSSVGIIANPAAGRDIRRLVAHGRLVPNQEKVNVIRRVFTGLSAIGVEKVILMPDVSMLAKIAADGISCGPRFDILDMPIMNNEQDSTKAAKLMTEMQVGCLVTLGGDGTNRAVAKGSSNTPLVPISTGTNNVFATTVEGTVAGMVAAVIANGVVDISSVTKVASRLDIQIDNIQRDIALVDLAVSKELFIGSRAIWDISTIHEIFLAHAELGKIGLSAIGAMLRPSTDKNGDGLHIRLGQDGTSVMAPVAPGIVTHIPIAEWSSLKFGTPVTIHHRPCTIALDGERSMTLSPGQHATVTLNHNGPTVVSIEKTLRQASQSGIFIQNEKGSS